MTKYKKIIDVNGRHNYYMTLENGNEFYVSGDVGDYIKSLEEAIAVTRSCESVKDKHTHTFEVDLNSKKMQESLNKQLEQIHNAPTRLFMYDSKTEKYIELKP
jgi:hypothetical protein